MPNPIPLRTKLQTEIEGLFQILPFDLLADGIKKLSRQLGYRIIPGRMRYLITVVRRDPERWLFNIPLAKGGRAASNERGPRYVCVMRDSEDQPYFNADEANQVRMGLRTAVWHAKSSMQHESEALTWAVPYHANPLLGRYIKSYARKIKQLAEDADEILEMIGDLDENENGA
jgi:hypothetical protein